MSKIYTSPICSCIICKEVKSSKGIYSHYISAHTAEGYQARVLAGKASASNHIKQKEKAASLREEYSTNPSYCKHCNTILPYNKRTSNFCGSSCALVSSHIKNPRKLSSTTKYKISTTLSNIIRPPYIRISQCLICNTYFEGVRKTCSKLCLSKLISTNSSKSANDRYNSGDMFGGHKNNKTYEYITKDNSILILESSYEVTLAKFLDSTEIKWTRPSFLKYYDKENKYRNYFADFYIQSLNLYVDTKNSYLIEKDRFKIQNASSHNNCSILVLGINTLSDTSNLIELFHECSKTKCYHEYQ